MPLTPIRPDVVSRYTSELATTRRSSSGLKSWHRSPIRP